MRFWPLFLVAALVACDSDDGAEDDPPADCVDCGGAAFPACGPGAMQPFGVSECQAVGWQACPSGFAPDASGWGCRDRMPASKCAAGTMSELGSDECVVIGNRTCAEGFERDESGWGCRAVLPDEPCTGATRAALGHTECIQVGSCDEPFPPPAASLFVDDDYADEELDATHYRSIQAAINNAVNGTVIAVEAGEYKGGLEIYTEVYVVGRCAAKVHVDAENAFTSGIWINAPTASIRGITLLRPELGFYINPSVASLVTATDLVIEEARGWGVYVPGSFDDPANPLKVVLDRVVVRNTRMSSEGSLDGGVGIYVESGSVVEVSRSELSGNHSAGVAALYGGVADLRNSVVRDNQGLGWMAGGIYATEGAAVQVRESALVGNLPYSAWAFGNNASLQMSDSVVGAPGGGDKSMQIGTGAALLLMESTVHAEPAASFEGGSTGNLNGSTVHGLQLVWGPSTVNLSESAVVDGGVRAYGSNSALVAGRSVFTGNDDGYPAIFADAGAVITLEGSAIEGFAGNGLVVQALSLASLNRSIVREVTVDETSALATGFRGAIAVSSGGQLTLSGSAVVDSGPYGIELESDAASTTGQLSESLVRGTHAADDATTLPAGIRVGGTSVLALDTSGLVDNEGHALFADGNATLGFSSSVVVGNRGSGDADGAAVWIGGAASVQMQSTAFADNVGVGLVATDSGRVTANGVLFIDNRAGATGRARAAVASDGGGIELTYSNVVGSEEVGLEVSGTGSVVRVTDGMIGLSSRGESSDMGHGAVSLDGGELHLTRVRFYGAAGAAAAFFSGGGSMQTSILDHNARAVHVQGTAISAEGPGSSSTVFLSTNNRYIDNLADLTRDTLEVPRAFDGDP